MKHRIRRSAPVLAGGALLVFAVATHGCKDIVVETITPLEPSSTPATGNLGDPCVPADEGNPRFPGFRVNELNLADHFDACKSGLCLVDHFQGRVSCPLGQAAPASCAGPGDPSCGGAGACVAAGSAGQFCDPKASDGGASQCASGVCDAQRSVCACAMDAQCPQGTACDPASKQCAQYVCKTAGCQTAGAIRAENDGKVCCAEGSQAPVSTGVCGQCAAGSGRAAAEAVYCSCRCGPPDLLPDAGGTYCACPEGFACQELIPYVGLGDPQLTGKFCVKPGPAYTGPDQCGAVSGHLDSSCAGVAGP